LILLLSLYTLSGSAGNADSSVHEKATAGQQQMQLGQADAGQPSLNSLMAEMNRNSERTLQLLDRIVSDGCSRQLQENTINLVANMTHNIQVMTEIMVRMGYNIEQMSRVPKAMNDFPFMP